MSLKLEQTSQCDVLTLYYFQNVKPQSNHRKPEKPNVREILYNSKSITVMKNKESLKRHDSPRRRVLLRWIFSEDKVMAVKNIIGTISEI